MSNQFPINKTKKTYKVIDTQLNVLIRNSPYPVCRKLLKDRPNEKLKIVVDRIHKYTI